MSRQPDRWADEKSEQAVLGAILLKNDALDEVAHMLTPKDFYFVVHARLFEAMIALSTTNQPIDHVTLDTYFMETGDELRGRIRDVSMWLATEAISAVNIGHYARIVKKKAAVRKTRQHCLEAISALDGCEDLDSAVGMLDRIAVEASEVAVGNAPDSYSMADVIREALINIETAAKRQGKLTGIASGLGDFDSLTGGFQKSDLIIIAGRPSMGKTGLLTGVLTAAAKAGHPVGFFSLEMPKAQIGTRLISSAISVEHRMVQRGKLSEMKWGDLTKRSAELAELPIRIDEKGAPNVADIRARARRMVRKHGVQLIGIDYLQLIAGDERKSREQQISHASRSLKALAKELNIPVIALSQLNRGPDSREDKRPKIPDLRESGSIEQDADLIVFVYREDYYKPTSIDKGIAELIVAKQRNGPKGRIKVKFFEETVTFAPLSHDNDLPGGLW